MAHRRLNFKRRQTREDTNDDGQTKLQMNENQRITARRRTQKLVICATATFKSDFDKQHWQAYPSDAESSRIDAKNIKLIWNQIKTMENWTGCSSIEKITSELHIIFLIYWIIWKSRLPKYRLKKFELTEQWIVNGVHSNMKLNISTFTRMRERESSKNSTLNWLYNSGLASFWHGRFLTGFWHGINRHVRNLMSETVRNLMTN